MGQQITQTSVLTDSQAQEKEKTIPSLAAVALRKIDIERTNLNPTIRDDVLFKVIKKGELEKLKEELLKLGVNQEKITAIVEYFSSKNKSLGNVAEQRLKLYKITQILPDFVKRFPPNVRANFPLLYVKLLVEKDEEVLSKELTTFYNNNLTADGKLIILKKRLFILFMATKNRNLVSHLYKKLLPNLYHPWLDFSKIDIQGFDLSFLGLNNIDFSYAKLDSVNLSHAKIAHTNFKKASLTHTQCQYSTWTSSSLKKAELFNANFDDAVFGKEVDFLDADLHKASCCRVDFRQTENFRKIYNGHQANFSEAIFSGMDLKGINAGGANFSGAKLEKTIFSSAYLRDANFHNADLTKASFNYRFHHRWRSISISGIKSKIAKTIFLDSVAEIIAGLMVGGCLVICSPILFMLWMYKVGEPRQLPQKNRFFNLRKVNFSGANLTEVDLEGKFINDADFTDAKLNKTKLKNATLTDCKTSGANFLHTTRGELTGHRLIIQNGNWINYSNSYLPLITGCNIESIINLLTTYIRGQTFLGPLFRHNVAEAKTALMRISVEIEQTETSMSEQQKVMGALQIIKDVLKNKPLNNSSTLYRMLDEFCQLQLNKGFSYANLAMDSPLEDVHRSPAVINSPN